MSTWFTYLFPVIIAIPPVLVWGYFYYKRDKLEPEPMRLIIYSFFYGALAVLPIFGLQYLFSYFPQLDFISGIRSVITNVLIATTLVLFLLAFLEEYFKHFMVVRLTEHHDIYFNQFIDGIEYSVMAALGFSYVENILYFYSGLSMMGWGGDYISMILFRSLGTMLAHTLFSGFFGYYYALSVSKRSNHIVRKRKYPLWQFYRHIFKALTFHIFRKHIWKNRYSQKGHDEGQLICEGLLIAVIFHTLFNYLNTGTAFGIPLTMLNIPLLVFGMYVMMAIFKHKFNVEIRTEPEEA